MSSCFQAPLVASVISERVLLIFARLLKLPLLTRYKDQILVAGRMCSEFCEVVQESVLSSLPCALYSRKKPPELSGRSLKFISKFLVTRLTVNSGLYHFHF